MPKPDSGANRHHVRIWIKWAIESGLLVKLPPLCDAEGCQTPQPTDQFARALLAELRDPESSRRPLKQIIADAQKFRLWVEARQKQSRQLILAELHPGDLGDWAPQRRPANPTDPPERPRPTSLKPPNPRRNPMWDDWVDG